MAVHPQQSPPASPDKAPPEKHAPHITNGAEASNLPPDADLPELTENQPSEVIKRAKKDLDEGQVDTEMRSTPGLDAGRKKKLLEDEKRG